MTKRILEFLFPKPKWVVECETAIKNFSDMLHEPRKLPASCYGTRKSFED